MAREPPGNDSVDSPLDDRSPEIEYPCPWTYRVIGRDESRLRQAIDDVAFALHYSVTLANHSRSGRYISLHLQVKVDGDQQRRDIFSRLAEHPEVAWVL